MLKEDLRGVKSGGADGQQGRGEGGEAVIQIKESGGVHT